LSRVAGEQKIILAISSRERQLFLPDEVGERFLPNAQWSWVNTEGLSPQAWPETLERLQPTVLVTAWSLPPLTVTPKSLRYICHLAGGVRFVPRHLIENGVLVSNWGQTISHTIAEHAVLLTLALLRNLPAWNNFIDRWQSRPDEFSAAVLETRSLRGRRVGLHGFGAIAREIARMLQPFQVKLTAYSHGVPAWLFDQYHVRQSAELDELFSSSNVLIECEAATEHNRGTVSERVLRLLPRGAVFVNVGRAAVVDHAALTRLAQEGRLRVGVDVFPHEPIFPNDPLRECALLSPHLAGPTKDGFLLLGRFALENLRRYCQGQPVEGQVTLETYDRAT
jgi:phosphoglycerate dehydrogenase-like enzyme